MKKVIFLFTVFIILIILIATAAQAPDYSGQIRKVHTNKCLSVQGNSKNNGAGLALGDCANKENFQFETITTLFGNSYFFLRAKHSQKCIQVYKGSTENGAIVNQWQCQDLPQFKWIRHKGTEGEYIINQNSQKCLHVDASSANIVQRDCAASTQWEFPD
jgi:hypothetical protein